jgi:hypothetical protein
MGSVWRIENARSLERRARREEQEVYARELAIVNRIVMRLDSLISDLLDVERLKQGYSLFIANR